MVSFIWSVKEILRDHYKRHEYGEVILPMVVLRRLDATLAEPAKKSPAISIKKAVLDRATGFQPPYDAHFDLLCRTAGLEFYNTSKFDFLALLGDEHAVVENFHDYLNGFSPNVREVIQAFDFWNHVDRLGPAGILFQVLGRFADPRMDLSPSRVSNLDMGYIYEELIRTVAEMSNEEAGEHFTPREVIELMVNLLVADDPDLHKPGRVVTVYDPTCGTGGMLTEAKAKLLSINATLKVHLRGQEVQPESFAVCTSDMLIKDERTAQIRFGDTLDNDRFPSDHFDYVIANPPYGKDWKSVEKKVKSEHRQQGMAGRFGPGLPPTSDGQMLFLLHMFAKLKDADNGGGRLAVVMNGSPLFSGDAGSGPSEIRRYLVENDLVEAIIGLPTELFYNTGIPTYIWVVTNNKSPERSGYIQLIDAREKYSKMQKSLGNKRNFIGSDHRGAILKLYEDFIETADSRVLPNEYFGYRQLTLERPLRLSYQVDASTLESAAADRVISRLPVGEVGVLMSRLRGYLGWRGSALQAADLVNGCTADIPRNPPSGLTKSLLNALSVKDLDGELVVERGGRPKADTSLRDNAMVPLMEDVDTYFSREVQPFAPDAWLDRAKDRIGYEIPFTRVFYEYEPPRPLDQIDAELRASRERLQALLSEVAGQ